MAWGYARTLILPVRICDDRADGSVCANMCGKRPFSWPYPESKEFSAVFGRFPGHLPFVSHCLADDGFCGCHQGPEPFWFRRRFWVRSCIRIMPSGSLGCSIGRFVAGDSHVRWNTSELNLPSLISELVECSYSLDQDVLSRGTLGVCPRLNSGLIVREDCALGRSACHCVYVECYVECQLYPSELCCIYK